MRAVSVSEAKARLDELVEAAGSTHERILVTRPGRPAVVLMAADDLESLQETVCWLSQPGIREAVDEAETEVASGGGLTSDKVRASLGLPRG
jgi:prevent-host-death family protein